MQVQRDPRLPGAHLAQEGTAQGQSQWHSSHGMQASAPVCHLLLLWGRKDHLPGCSHHSSWHNSWAGSTTHHTRQENQLEKLQGKARGVIRALENVTCDGRWKRLGPFKPGGGKGEDVITVLKYVEGNCRKKAIKCFLNNLGKL